MNIKININIYFNIHYKLGLIVQPYSACKALPCSATICQQCYVILDSLKGHC